MKGNYTNFKEAVEKYCAEQGVVVTEAKIIKLTYMNPPIDKLEIGMMASLVNCEELRLSTNSIQNLVPLGNMRRLKILTLSRNFIKTIRHLDDVGQTLEQLWLSYNLIEKLNNLSKLEKLKVIYLAYNKISNWNEVDKLRENPALEKTVMLGNPIYSNTGSDADARLKVLKHLPQLQMIDGRMVSNEDRDKIQDEDAPGDQ